MTVQLKKPPASSTPLRALTAAELPDALAAAPPATRRWLEATGFRAAPHTHALVPAADGGLAEVWAGLGQAGDVHQLSSLPMALPQGSYRLAADGAAVDAEAAALSWRLGSYAFDRYRPRTRAPATLVLSPSDGARRGLQMADAVALTRDLVNTPAEALGPAELAEAVQALARTHGAKLRQVRGEALLKAGFPSVHAVGRASTREPRLIELNWGRPGDPRLVLVGKGVCFDTGGLDIKTADGMRQMKKDMGGAAHALALAGLVMARALPVRLQLLIPAVDNAIAGNAYRPGDVFRTRAGLHIEIGNTDAEGRVVLCDALAYGAEGGPDLMVDLATLTGAARVALGPQLPALFSNRFEMARELMDLGLRLGDPLWHLPLWRDYRPGIESSIGDIVNTGRNAHGGAINAALFLDHFVPEATPWLHIDLFAWNDTARPGRPVGGEAQSLRALLAFFERRYGRG
ncbi:M17 family metallopeptidase [Ideonella sp. A 288]|uniref:leucyl aminopeptidase family protein n=1 Tax=Ideonella sp. A 288 TaxID=1962181 RepID=UPI000B4BA5F3|nr:leucyl aminopeptidase family protein [Ideonella sp. A 288]